MSDRAIRRLPVIDNGSLVGIVSLGDLAEDRDPDSVLGKIRRHPTTEPMATAKEAKRPWF